MAKDVQSRLLQNCRMRERVNIHVYMSRSTRKPTLCNLRNVSTQISLRGLRTIDFNLCSIDSSMQCIELKIYMSRSTRKPIVWNLRYASTQIRLRSPTMLILADRDIE